MAYRKAPQWLNQRMHEDALSIATKLIFEDYAEINRRISQSSSIIEHIKVMNDFYQITFEIF